MARPPKETVVSKRDREELEGWLRAGNTPKKLAERAQILLGFADGETSTEIAERLGLSRNAVYRWRSRYEPRGTRGPPGPVSARTAAVPSEEEGS